MRSTTKEDRQLQKDTNPQDIPFFQVLADYEILEPEQTDRWNPLLDDVELYHRLALFREITLSLRLSAVESLRQKILDVGCGNGRSCRMYLDFGFSPSQITGIDIRYDAVSLAKKIHPGIEFLSYSGDQIPFPDNTFTWVSLCTVMSSIRSQRERGILAKEVARVIAPGGHFFYWDLRWANAFAGGGLLTPEELFPDFVTISSGLVCIYGTIEDILRPGIAQSTLKILARRFCKRPTHCSALFRKPRV